MIRKYPVLILAFSFYIALFFPLNALQAESFNLSLSSNFLSTSDPLPAEGNTMRLDPELGHKSESSASRPWYKKWWVWTIAIAVIGGAVAASSSSSGDGGGAPATGSVSFSGETP